MSHNNLWWAFLTNASTNVNFRIIFLISTPKSLFTRVLFLTGNKVNSSYYNFQRRQPKSLFPTVSCPSQVKFHPFTVPSNLNVSPIVNKLQNTTQKRRNTASSKYNSPPASAFKTERTHQPSNSQPYLPVTGNKPARNALKICGVPGKTYHVESLGQKVRTGTFLPQHEQEQESKSSPL